MIVIGLTGSIGMGKSVLARQFRKLGVAVHESDKVVHKLLGPRGAAVEKVAKAFPAAFKKGVLDRKVLGGIVFKDPAARKKLEKILHPMVRASSLKFLNLCRTQGRKMAVLDIPLLFETGQARRFDHIVCVTAPQFVQTRRVLSRNNMTRKRLNAILELQLPDAVKQQRSDTVINTARGYRATMGDLRRLIEQLDAKGARAGNEPRR